MIIRAAKVGDEVGLARVWYEMVTHGQSLEPGYGDLKPKADCISLMTDRFRAAIGLPGYVTILAEIDGEVVGYAAANIANLPQYRVKTEKLQVFSVSVTERFRSQGIGSALLDRIEEVAKNKYIPIVEINTVHCRNRAVAFYERQGFAAMDCVMIKHLEPPRVTR